MTSPELTSLQDQLARLLADDPALAAALRDETDADVACALLCAAAQRQGQPLDAQLVRATLQQTQGQAVPLDDKALDSVAGGSEGTAVLMSVLTWGLLCAGISIEAAVKGKDCGTELRR